MCTLIKNIARISLLYGFILITITTRAWSRDYFDPSLLNIEGAKTAIDLSFFEKSGDIMPGTYLVNLYLNKELKGQYNIVFTKKDNGKVIPELTPSFLSELGVNTDSTAELSSWPKDRNIEDLSSFIPESKVSFDFQQLRLDLSIPQIAMKPNSQSSIDSKLWDDGIPALLLNYTINGGRNQQKLFDSSGHFEQVNIFSNFRYGVNFDAWRFRGDFNHTRDMTKSENFGKHNYVKSDFLNNYIQRDIRSLRSEVTIGETNTGNEIFDSFSFRGFKLNSSDEMLPTNIRGFAPIITGVAHTNARLTVSQNGNIIYQSYVSPGQFRIDDLYQTAQGGDITITLAETDGNVRTWTQAYSTLPIMQRTGWAKYEISAGTYDRGITESSRRSEFIMGSLSYGLPYNFTLYGGGLLSDKYQSFSLGSGVSLGFLGALSADITSAYADVYDDGIKKGKSYRVRYSKSLLETGTSIDLTAYRYSTKGYYSFSDFNNVGYKLIEGQVPWALERQRSDFQIRLSQQLGFIGSLYLSGSRSEYWTKKDRNNTLSLGYNTNIKNVNIGVSYTIDRVNSNNNWPSNRQLMFNVQIPINFHNNNQLSNYNYANYQVIHNSNGKVQQQTGLSGSAISNKLSWNAFQAWSNDKYSDSTSTFNLGWQGDRGMATLGYSYSNQSNSLNFGSSGGMVVHSQGFTLSQQLGTSVAVISAPNAAGVKVMSGDLSTNSNGFTVLPYLTPYQNNLITIDPSTLPDSVDLPQNSVSVYPTKGAVVMAEFETRVGYQALITIKRGHMELPFGAVVTPVDQKHERNSGIVGDAGQVYMSGLPESGVVRAVWGIAASQQCNADFDLSSAKTSKNNPVRILTIYCKG